MISVGSTDISKVYVGSTEAVGVYLGDVKVWPVLPYLFGLDKSGNQVLPTNAWTTVTGWVIQSDRPDTVITNNGLLLPAGRTVSVSAQNQRSGSHSGNKVRLWDALSSTVLFTGTTTGTYPFFFYTFTPSADVVVQLQAISTSSTTANRTIVASTFTYLTATEQTT
jgi:hypothetical protein